MKKVLVTFLLIAAAGFVWSCLTTPWLSVLLLRRALRSMGPDVVVREAVIGRQEFAYPDRFAFFDIVVSFDKGGMPYFFRGTGLRADHVLPFFFKDQQILLTAENLRADIGPGHMSGAQAQIWVSFGGKGMVVSGQVALDQASWNRWTACALTGDLVATTEQIALENIRAQVFGGSVTGQAVIIPGMPMSYDVRMALEDVVPNQIREAGGRISAQVEGRVSGVVEIKGRGNRIRSVDADLSLPAGGSVNAALLATLSGYLPQSVEKKRLDRLINSRRKLAVEVFSFTIKTEHPNHLSGGVRLSSKEVNLNIDLAHDIYTDGTIDALVSSVRGFLP